MTMKLIVLIFPILLVGCLDSMEYVQLNNQTDIAVKIKKDNGEMVSISPNSKVDVPLNDLLTLKDKKNGFKISIFDEGKWLNCYISLNNNEFRDKYLSAKIFDKDRYLFKYKSNELYVLDPKYLKDMHLIGCT